MNENLIKYYKDLHKIPEEGFKEFKTQQYIFDVLSKLNCKIFKLEPTGILAYFDYGYDEVIAFRAEMDGLEIEEKNNFDYISTHPGFMHACGHDGHMAMLLVLAEYLNEIKCLRNVCLIFQPSEEKYGGALKVIYSNPFKEMNIKEVYGIHLWPGLKKGYIGSRSKVLMASSTEIDITIKGKCAHIANAKDGIDTIKLAFELLEEINPEEVIFNCGKITTLGARNIVCPYAFLECSLRSFYKIKRKNFLKILNQSAVKLANKTQAEFIINSHKYIPELKNDLILYEKYRHLIDEIVAPVYQAEDFSFYGLNAKTLFMFLGIGNNPPLHSSNFNFDLEVLEKGLKVLVGIVTTR